MSSSCVAAIILSLLFNTFDQSKCEDITIWDNQDVSQRQNSVTIRHNFDKGLITSILDVVRGQKLLPMCAMVGCATKATQCLANGGKEMVNKMSVDDYTQAYFKSTFTLDKTFLSINCNKMLVPCCFARTPAEVTTPRPPPQPAIDFNVPQVPVSSQPSFIRELVSAMPEIPPMSVFIMSNICGGIGGGAGDVSCNQED